MKHTDRSATPAPPARLVERPDFVRLWLIGGIANTTRWTELLATGLWTFAATGSALTVALVLMVRSIPLLLLGAMMGLVADRLDRRLMLMGVQTMCVAMAAGICLLSFTGALATWHLVIYALSGGLAGASEMAVRRRMMADAVPQADMVRAMALDTLTGSITRAVGPFAGGALFQVLGIGAAAAIAAAMHGSALLLALRVRATAPAAQAAPPATGAWGSVTTAARVAFRTPSLRAVLIATATMNVFGFSFMSALPAFGDAAFGVGGALIGLLAAAEPVGALAGGVVLARTRRPQEASAFLTGCAAFLVLLTLAALSPAYWLCWVLLAVGGVGVAWFGALQTSLVMLHAPAEIRSRVLGLVTTSIGFGPLGVLAVGWLADGIGPRAAVAALAVAGLLVLGAVAATLRR